MADKSNNGLKKGSKKITKAHGDATAGAKLDDKTKRHVQQVDEHQKDADKDAELAKMKQDIFELKRAHGRLQESFQGQEDTVVTLRRLVKGLNDDVRGLQRSN